MKILIHDCGRTFHQRMQGRYDQVIHADGRYAPCQGCFHCWTKHPATCAIKDTLHEICRVVVQADDLLIITENWYGGYSPAVKNLLDRSIGSSTPMSTYRGGQMHHTLRYGKHHKRSVYVYGDISDGERETWEFMARRNALNDGYQQHEVIFVPDTDKLEEVLG